MDKITEQYTAALNELLAERAKIDAAVTELNVQYVADIEAWVRSTEDPGKVEGPIGEPKTQARSKGRSVNPLRRP